MGASGRRLPACPRPGLGAGAIAVLACAAPGALAAQDPGTEGRWTAGAALVHHVQADALASPLRYGGVGPGLSLGYARVGPRSRTALHVAYGGPSLESRISRPGVSTEQTHRLTVSVPHLRGVRGGQRLDLLLGGQLTGDVLYRKHAYPTSTEHFADAFVLLEAAAGLEYRASERLRVEQRLAVPLLGLLWRSPYTGLKYAPEAALALPHQLQGLRHELALTRAAGPRLSLTAAHELVLLRHADPWELATVTQRLRLGVELRRGGGAAVATPAGEDGR